MKVKCRGYEGTLLNLEAEELLSRSCVKDMKFIIRYAVKIRINENEIIYLYGIDGSEIEVIHEN